MIKWECRVFRGFYTFILALTTLISGSQKLAAGGSYSIRKGIPREQSKKSRLKLFCRICKVSPGQRPLPQKCCGKSYSGVGYYLREAVQDVCWDVPWGISSWVRLLELNFLGSCFRVAWFFRLDKSKGCGLGLRTWVPSSSVLQFWESSVVQMCANYWSK